MRPPAFEEATNLRQRVRAAGLDPDHWYAVEYARAVRPGTTVATRFWGAPIALTRARNGTVFAHEDRGEGRPYPVRRRYGLVWVFPGDAARAAATPLPEVPELEGPSPWAYVPIDFTWRAHHSMVIDNLCDLTHAHLHRRFTSFQPGRLLASEADDTRVLLRYEARVGPLVRTAVAPSPMTICYEYPYHWAAFEWSGIEGPIKYWTFLLPLDARTTRVFFVMSYDALRIPGLPFRLPRRLVRWALRAVQPVVRSLLDQDGVALEAEQAGYEAHWAQPVTELNPAVSLLHRLTTRKWEAVLARPAPASQAVTV